MKNKEFKGTPGEWLLRPRERATKNSPKSRVTRVVTRLGNAICRVNATHKLSCQANAKLIASAPELLDFAIKFRKFREHFRNGTKPELGLNSLDELAEKIINKALN